MSFVAKLASLQRYCDASVLRQNFPPRTRRSKLKLESGTFSPRLIPSLTMNCQPISQPRPPRDQILLYFTLKPCPSNWSHFIRPLLSHVLFTREGCQLGSQESRGQHPMSVGNSHCLMPLLAPPACGICWDRSCRIGDIHTNTIQMEG